MTVFALSWGTTALGFTRSKFLLIQLFGIVFFAIFPGLFNSLAHSVGVKNPPDLLSILADLFLLVICVRFSWEIGRSEDRTRILAEEVALLRKDLDDRTGVTQ